LRRFHEPLSFIDSAHAITEDVAAVPAKPAKSAKSTPSSNGASQRKKKKGAKS
jgi:hypothetical protein